MNEKLLKENKELKVVNSSLTRSKMINESIAHLPVAKQEMVKGLVKDVPTNKLMESLKKYVPMIMEDNSAKNINKDERVLSESKKMRVMTGSKENRAMNRLTSDAALTEEVDKEIEKIIAQSKL
jgi:cysteinyl-tRNA synthetase